MWPVAVNDSFTSPPHAPYKVPVYAFRFLGTTARHDMIGPWIMLVGVEWIGDIVLFTDESRYYLDYTDQHVRVWRRPGERFHAANIAEHDRYGGGSIMVWGGISWDEILDTQVKLYAGAVGDQFILKVLRLPKYSKSIFS